MWELFIIKGNIRKFIIHKLHYDIFFDNREAGVEA